MSAKNATGSAAPSIKKWVIEKDVKDLLHSYALARRLKDKSFSNGFIELFLRCLNLTALRRAKKQSFSDCHSLLRVDLSGCPKLESVPEMAFGGCSHLVSEIFGEHSNITNLGEDSFGECVVFTIITLPDKLEVIERVAFGRCTSLERVVCNKNLKSIGENAF